MAPGTNRHHAVCNVQHQMKHIRIHVFASLIMLSAGTLTLLSQCQAINENADSSSNGKSAHHSQVLDAITEKQKGVHFFGRVDSNSNFRVLVRNNVEWVTLVPWGFQNDYDSPTVTHTNSEGERRAEYNAHWRKQIEMARARGFKVFFKPHIWIMSPSDGKWRSHIFPPDDESWEQWKSTYRDFILRYAKVAEQGKAELFCIGVEFSRLAVEKPDFWRELTQEVRDIFSGKITYAANWYQEYEQVTFWDELDYIGIQAYQPLAKNDHPTVEQISKGWSQYLPTMEAVYKKWNRKILFTEMGYKSTAGSAIKPWEWIEDSTANQDYIPSSETQANCYEAFFNTIWKKEWFAGVHIWSFRSDYVDGNDDGYQNMDFTPLGKPAEKIIAKGFE